MHIVECPVLRVVHRTLDRYLASDKHELTTDEKRKKANNRTFFILKGSSVFPYAGGPKARKALRIWHSKCHPELYAGKNLKKILEWDSTFANGNAITEYIKDKYGFDAGMELKKKGRWSCH